MIHVIFICTGNICRSAMAEGYLKYRIRELKRENDVIVSSAGTHATEGENSPEYAKRSIKKYGANIDSHASTELKNANLDKANFILVMTQRHKKDIINKYPHLEEKIKLLGEYAKDKEYKEIDDPWGYNYIVYENCAKEIVESIEGFIKREI